MTRKVTVKFIMAVLVMCGWVCSLRAEQVSTQKDEIPAWMVAGRPIKASQVPKEDYHYLARWIEKNAKLPQDYIIDLFNKHQIVILGELHYVKEHKDFVIEIIPRLYREAGVRCIGWEFSRYADNERLNKLVTAPEFDHQAALNFARDQVAHEWDSKEHWDIIEAVWQLNKSLKPNEEKMRFLGLDRDVDYCRFFIASKTKSQDSPEFQEILADVLKRDGTMAEQVEKEIINKGEKGLVFVGRCHDYTDYEFPPNINSGRPIMGNLLYKKHGDRIFQVWLDDGGLAPIGNIMELRANTAVGFDLCTSPFANILGTPDWNAPKVPLSKIARGYVYLGPTSSLHKNTPIKGFVTDEMFKKYKQYYEIDFGQSFKDANEVDMYLQAHRFPKP